MAAASVAFWAACGGGQTYNLTGSGTVTGTFNGVSLNAGDAVSNLVSQSGGSAGAILITTSTAQCNLINNHQALKNGQALALELGTQSGNTVSAPTLGTHTVFTSGGIVGQNGKVGIAQYVATNASCSGNVLEAVSGTITLTRVEATGYG
ncbi:MAG TPA: hypothetical protein VG496_01555, partial [Myxococcales bacterium]|nr:hypothetical protein [Myxococcales bacterium]